MGPGVVWQRHQVKKFGMSDKKVGLVLQPPYDFLFLQRRPGAQVAKPLAVPSRPGANACRFDFTTVPCCAPETITVRAFCIVSALCPLSSLSLSWSSSASAGAASGCGRYNAPFCPQPLSTGAAETNRMNARAVKLGRTINSGKSMMEQVVVDTGRKDRKSVV